MVWVAPAGGVTVPLARASLGNDAAGPKGSPAVGCLGG